MKKTICCLLSVCFLLVGCGDDDTSTKETVPVTNNTSQQNSEQTSSENNPKSLDKSITTYENEHGEFEVLYSKDNLGLNETYEDFGLQISAVEYGVFSVSEAYDYYPDIENNEGKIGYIKVHIAMDLPPTLAPALFFYPHHTVLTITDDINIPPVYSDNNFADEVAVNLGEVAEEEGYLFYLLSPMQKEKLDETNSFTLTSFAPFTSSNMEVKEGFTFNISLN